MDLAAWWRARRWRALLELIDQLPDTSRFREAVHNDPEQARYIAMAQEFSDGSDDQAKAEPWSPRLSEYGLTEQLLRELVHNTAVIAGAKNPKYFPSPRTEVDRQRELLAHAHAISMGAKYGFSAEDFM